MSSETHTTLNQPTTYFLFYYPKNDTKTQMLQRLEELNLAPPRNLRNFLMQHAKLCTFVPKPHGKFAARSVPKPATKLFCLDKVLPVRYRLITTPKSRQRLAVRTTLLFCRLQLQSNSCCVFKKQSVLGLWITGNYHAAAPASDFSFSAAHSCLPLLDCPL
jgi:hypothetical protein